MKVYIAVKDGKIIDIFSYWLNKNNNYDNADYYKKVEFKDVKIGKKITKKELSNYIKVNPIKELIKCKNVRKRKNIEGLRRSHQISKELR